VSLFRLKREQYAVGEAEHPTNGVTVTVGIYYAVPATEDVEELTVHAQTIAQCALWAFGGNHSEVVEHVAAAVERYFPGRPYYAETREEGHGVQVYQPYGMPQDTIHPPESERDVV
jgi:hypothetical protein